MLLHFLMNVIYNEWENIADKKTTTYILTTSCASYISRIFVIILQPISS